MEVIGVTGRRWVGGHQWEGVYIRCKRVVLVSYEMSTAYSGCLFQSSQFVFSGAFSILPSFWFSQGCQLSEDPPPSTPTPRKSRAAYFTCARVLCDTYPSYETAADA